MARLVSDGLRDFESQVLQVIGNTRHALSFARFAHRYGKRYETVGEMKLRFEIFSENLKLIKSTNKKGLPYTCCESHRLGAAQNCSATARGNHKLTDAVLPETKDWREDGIVSPVKDQGNCGSCWTFSTTGALEAAYKQAFGKQILPPSNSLWIAPKLLITLAAVVGYHLKPLNISSTMVALRPRKHILTLVKMETASSLRQMLPSKSATLSTFLRPVSVAFEVVHDFRFYKEGVYTSDTCGSDPMDVNHAVLAVGYGVENGIPYWLTKNSWGDSWGDNGYFKMELGKNMCGVATCASYPVVA
ncbi:hypothetical protein FNV43_RR13312 [Rhamnella rubrinervis]|uniref:Peptidase C1A papain C-terminal domain-containing protein n=1 Tax=Rhamnella rubrinervis TaxID=2594499 RepID=A0A8K0H0V5_9ROSA|nr:hypothetical protein FNV43_RR13312 [Rhamnella rubrinervis]